MVFGESPGLFDTTELTGDCSSTDLSLFLVPLSGVHFASTHVMLVLICYSNVLISSFESG